MKVVAKMNYYDRDLGQDIVKGTELDVTETRAAVLINAGVASEKKKKDQKVKEPKAQPEDQDKEPEGAKPDDGEVEASAEPDEQKKE